MQPTIITTNKGDFYVSNLGDDIIAYSVSDSNYSFVFEWHTSLEEIQERINRQE